MERPASLELDEPSNTLESLRTKIFCVNMNPAHTDPPQLSQDNNPFAAPKLMAETDTERAIYELMSVARVFKTVGWLVVMVYGPLVVFSIGVLISILIGYIDAEPQSVLGGTTFNCGVLAMAIQYILTGRRIAKPDPTVRQRALFLSCVLMAGFPIFTFLGIRCYRDIKRYLVDSPPFA